MKRDSYIKRYKPVTSSLRHRIIPQQLTKSGLRLNRKTEDQQYEIHSAALKVSDLLKTYNLGCALRTSVERPLSVLQEPAKRALSALKYLQHLQTDRLHMRSIPSELLNGCLAKTQSVYTNLDLTETGRKLFRQHPHLSRRFKKVIGTSAGRNNSGKITVRHRGYSKTRKGISKKYPYSLDLNRFFGEYSLTHKVKDLQYSAYHTGFLATLTPVFEIPALCSVDALRSDTHKGFFKTPEGLRLASLPLDSSRVQRPLTTDHPQYRQKDASLMHSGQLSEASYETFCIYYRLFVGTYLPAGHATRLRAPSYETDSEKATKQFSTQNTESGLTHTNQYAKRVLRTSLTLNNSTISFRHKQGIRWPILRFAPTVVPAFSKSALREKPEGIRVASQQAQLSQGEQLRGHLQSEDATRLRIFGLSYKILAPEGLKIGDIIQQDTSRKHTQQVTLTTASQNPSGAERQQSTKSQNTLHGLRRFRGLLTDLNTGYSKIKQIQDKFISKLFSRTHFSDTSFISNRLITHPSGDYSPGSFLTCTTSLGEHLTDQTAMWLPRRAYGETQKAWHKHEVCFTTDNVNNESLQTFKNAKWAQRTDTLGLSGQTLSGGFAHDKHRTAPRTYEMDPQTSRTQLGFSTYLSEIPVGSTLYNVETIPGKGGKIARSAGTSCVLLKRYNSETQSVQKDTEQLFSSKIESEIKKTEISLCVLRLPSGEVKLLSSRCKATFGRVSNHLHFRRKLGKAGASRWLGKRPTVRGEAMNPVDHPHGGKSHGSGGKGNPAKTKWGKLAKWVKTRKSHTHVKRLPA